MIQKTKNIIFDFGNVLLDLHQERSERCMEQLLGLPYDMYHEHSPGCFADFETGSISETEFIGELSAFCGRPIERQALIDCWNALLGELPMHRIHMLRELKQRYRLFLLSNTNATHIAHVHTYLAENDLEFWSLFDRVFLSHELGLRKPDPAIFEYVLQEASLDPAETIFIDDGPMHVAGALAAGIPAVRHDPTEDITALIRRLELWP
jgi:putative hydrolase of the HAD superfamily